MRTFVLAAVLIALAGQARAETILHLSDSETVMVHPDELVGTLRVSVVADTPADAQRVVNEKMSAALERAKAVAAASVSTGGYWVSRQEKSSGWQANQTLTVRGHDGAALLELAGALQQQGLAMDSLSWQLSREASRKAEDDAMRQALGKLRARTDEAAGLLGLRFVSFKNVNIAGTGPFPVPMRAMAMAAAPAAPSAVPEDVPVAQTVEADVVLAPP